MFIFNLFTFVAGFQFDLSAVAPVAPVGSSPDPEHIGGPRLKPVHRHHVWAGLQDRVVLLPLILKRRTEQQERIKNWYYRYDLKGNIKSNTGKKLKPWMAHFKSLQRARSVHLTKFSFVHRWTICSHLYMSVCQLPNLILFTLGGNMWLLKSRFTSFLDFLVGECVCVRVGSVFVCVCAHMYEYVCRRMNKE